MPLHPLAQKHLEDRAAAGALPPETLPLAEARAQAVRLSRLAGPGEAVAHVVDRLIAGPQGEIPIRIYRPDARGPLPLLVFFHGGGWVLGNLETFDPLCRALANAAGCIVVSVNYRHAPEHKFPAAADDAYAATAWVVNNAAEMGGDATRVAVGGYSAGGNLAAAVTLMARERGGPRLAAQALLVPITDYNFDTGSYRDHAEGFGLTRSQMQWFWNLYLSDEASGWDPRASPLRAESLRDLPPALVVTAEYDPLRDEGLAYARRLREAGVAVQEKCYAGMVHMFLGPDAMAEIAAYLRAAFAGSAK